MSSIQFSHDPAVRHRVSAHGDDVQVDAIRLAVQAIGSGAFVTTIDGRSCQLQAVAHGDAVYVQLRGRAWRLDKIDPALGDAAGADGARGVALAPMPGVVVSLQAQPGQRVAQGDALLVIESMKLQMTIGAAADGTVVELPFTVGQTFQRGAVLARIEGAGADAGGGA